MALGSSVASVVMSLFTYLVLFIRVFYFFFLVSLAKSLSTLSFQKANSVSLIFSYCFPIFYLIYFCCNLRYLCPSTHFALFAWLLEVWSSHSCSEGERAGVSSPTVCLSSVLSAKKLDSLIGLLLRRDKKREVRTSCWIWCFIPETCVSLLVARFWNL